MCKTKQFVCMHVSLHNYLPVCINVFLFVRLTICLLACLCLAMSVCVRLSAWLCIYLPVCPSIIYSTCLSACLSASACMSIYARLSVVHKYNRQTNMKAGWQTDFQTTDTYMSIYTVKRTRSKQCSPNGIRTYRRTWKRTCKRTCKHTQNQTLEANALFHTSNRYYFQ